jgi:hypothetical protein
MCSASANVARQRLREHVAGPLQGNGLVNVPAATNTHPTVDELLNAAFSVSYQISMCIESKIDNNSSQSCLIRTG